MTPSLIRLRARCLLRAIAILASLVAQPGWALAPDRPIDDYVQNRWSIEQGLPQVSVLALAQDADGYIWVGTQSGLARFDGLRFTVYRQENTPELGGDMIFSLKADTAGRLWIGSYQGLSRYAAGVFTAIKAPTQNPLEIEAIDVSPDGKRVVVGTPQGAFQVNDDRLVADPALSGPVSALLFTQGALWVGTDGGIIREENGNAQFQAISGLGSAPVTSLALGQGTIWAGTAKGLFRLGSKGWEPFAVGPPSREQARIGFIYEDRDANLWVGSHLGLTRIRNGAVVEFTPASSSIIAPSYRAAIEDTEGSLWLGSFSLGLARFWNGLTQRFSSSRGLKNPLVWSVAPGKDGAVWTGTDDGLSLLEHGRFHEIVPGSQLPDPSVYTLLVEGDAVWIGTRHGLAYYDGKQVQQPAAFAPLLPLQINAILRDREGVLWIGTSIGLYRWQNEHLDAIAYAEGDQGWVRSLFQTSAGKLIVGSERGLMQIRDGRLWHDSDHPGLPPLDILSIDEPAPGDLMVGSMSTMLYGYKNGDWFRYGGDQGVLPNRAFFIGHANGMLWVAGERGLFRVPLPDLAAVREGRLERASSEALLNLFSAGSSGGQLGYCCNGAGNAKGFIEQGRIWLPTREGVVSMDTSLVQRNGMSPPLHIENVKFRDQTVPLRPAQIVRAPLGARDFMFTFAALSFQNPFAVQIKYRLVGYDHTWQMIENPERTIRYTNLSPGTYTFEVIASTTAGVWTDTPARATLIVPPHLYEMRTFQAFCLLLLVLLIYLLYWLKLRSIEQQQRLLENLVAQRTEALAQANRQLQDASTTDPLTGLRNRRFVVQQLPSDLVFYQRKFEQEGNGDPTVLLFVLLDVDHFKTFNDTYGHHSGDVALAQLAGCLSRLVRTADYIVRWGGEEFLIVFRPMRRSEVDSIIERLRSGIESEELCVGDQKLTITCSIGFSTLPLRARFSMAQHWQRMLEVADQALYFVKRHGRNGWAGFHTQDGANLAQVIEALQLDMQRLLERGEFTFAASSNAPDRPQTWTAPAPTRPNRPRFDLVP